MSTKALQVSNITSTTDPGGGKRKRDGVYIDVIIMRTNGQHLAVGCKFDIGNILCTVFAINHLREGELSHCTRRAPSNDVASRLAGCHLEYGEASTGQTNRDEIRSRIEVAASHGESSAHAGNEFVGVERPYVQPLVISARGAELSRPRSRACGDSPHGSVMEVQQILHGAILGAYIHSLSEARDGDESSSIRLLI
jgi:hypothetical protein